MYIIVRAFDYCVQEKAKMCIFKCKESINIIDFWTTRIIISAKFEIMVKNY